MKYRDDGFYSDNNCAMLHASATKIDADEKQVLLEDGGRVPYDKLLVAAGSSAFVPPFEGLETVDEKYTFMSLDDARRLDGTLCESKRVLIIGAGLVQGHLENRGVEFRLSSSVKRFDRNTAILESGVEIAFDMLVLAVGIRPNTVLLNGIAKIDRGIVINEKSETSATGIYAAGDCTQTTDVSSGQNGKAGGGEIR